MPCCGCWWNGRQRHRPPDPDTSVYVSEILMRRFCDIQYRGKAGEGYFKLHNVTSQLRSISACQLLSKRFFSHGEGKRNANGAQPSTQLGRKPAPNFNEIRRNVRISHGDTGIFCLSQANPQFALLEIFGVAS
uniref:SFRICE_011555 n=1 Tax=Spodoptera frugiperda TaxID=7108 RepID=A0A2H1VC54_SPOFR